MTNAAECTGSKTFVVATPYNAKGRKMNLVTCPACNREWRKTGHATNGVIPVHAA